MEGGEGGRGGRRAGDKGVKGGRARPGVAWRTGAVRGGRRAPARTRRAARPFEVWLRVRMYGTPLRVDGGIACRE